jgi:hypothetical protein
MKRFLDLGIDLYGYVTFTTPSITNVRDDMRAFVDALQDLDPLLPLRVTPLEIRMFTPVVSRAKEAERASLINQNAAIEAWQTELESRFTSSYREGPITAVRLRTRRETR